MTLESRTKRLEGRRTPRSVIPAVAFLLPTGGGWRLSVRCTDGTARECTHDTEAAGNAEFMRLAGKSRAVLIVGDVED